MFLETFIEVIERFSFPDFNRQFLMIFNTHKGKSLRAYLANIYYFLSSFSVPLKYPRKISHASLPIYFWTSFHARVLLAFITDRLSVDIICSLFHKIKFHDKMPFCIY